MKIEINNLTKEKTDLKFLEKIAEKTTKLVKLKISELSIAIVDDARIKLLNKKHLNRNKVTDVLAFGYGEIIICLPQARRQAKELRHSLKEELKTLLIHGILHLAGFNDETKTDYKKMMVMQEKFLKNISIW